MTEDAPLTEEPGNPTTPTVDEDDVPFDDPVRLNCGLFALIAAILSNIRSKI